MKLRTLALLAALTLVGVACDDDDPASRTDTLTPDTSTSEDTVGDQPTPDVPEDTAVDSTPSDTAPGDTNPGDTAPNDTEPNDTAPNDIEPGDVPLDIGEDMPADGDAQTADIVQDIGEDTVIDTPCPSDPPASDATCPRVGLICQYGDEPRLECRPLATCTDHGWSVETPSCTDPPTAVCPETRELAASQVCDVQDAYCTYDGMICHCSNCYEYPVGGCQGDPIWQCDVPNVNEGCPTARPNYGVGCAEEDLLCEYECGEDGARRCTLGVWVTAEGWSCPVSRRSAKTGIDYLTRDELEAVAQTILRFRLAEYEYTDPALSGREHLGFIIEDVGPDSPAVDPRRGRVDLYGYTSMLLAAVQAQQARIDALEKEVRALRAAQDAK